MNIEKNFAKNKPSEDEEGITRREFLKKVKEIGTGATMVAIGAGGLVKIIEEDNKREKEKSLKRLEPEEQEKEEGEPKESEVKKDEDMAEKGKEENIANAFFKAHKELARSRFWPKELLTRDIQIAQQLQESKFNKEAKSNKGAVGVMQNTQSSVIDVVRYLNKLKRNKEIEYDGPRELSKDQLKEIMTLILKDANCSRIFGKIYLTQLWDGSYGYGVGQVEYKAGKLKEAQKKLLASYNAGSKAIKDESEEKWPEQSIDYCKKIFNYEKRLKNIRRVLAEKEICLKNEDYAAMLLAREMDKPQDIKDKYWLLEKYLKKIKAELIKKNGLLEDEDLRIIISG